MEKGPGPHLATAVLCERVLEEKTGVLSLIRIVDRIVWSAGEADLPSPSINLVACISFKAGDARGSHDVVIQQETPSGIRQPETRLSALFEGEDRGVNVIVGINLAGLEEGLHWFDIGLDAKFVTRIPLRVVHQRVALGEEPSP